MNSKLSHSILCTDEIKYLIKLYNFYCAGSVNKASILSAEIKKSATSHN